MPNLKTQPEDLAAPNLTTNGLRVLEKRYIQRIGDEPQETAGGRLWAVASEVAKGSEAFGAHHGRTARCYYDMIANGDFVPNSPTLMNAGKDNGLQLSACFVLPVGDSMEEIFETVKRAALVHQSGGGTGFAFSRLRPAGDMVGSTGGVASGPVSFMEVFNDATEQVKQGGTRRGANMGVLRVDHPDIIEFINCKRELRGREKLAYERAAPSLNEVQREVLRKSLLENQISNFNISVAITDEFMEALIRRGSYRIRHPVTGEMPIDYAMQAELVWSFICKAAWETGDPGLLFIDRINNSRSNPIPSLEVIESSNPCGEQALGPNDVCNLGSINLAKFVKGQTNLNLFDRVDWDRLGEVTRAATRFMDDVITVNPYPDQLIREKAYANRRLGLGVMGWADLLIRLGVPYASEEALALAEMVMKFINSAAHDQSRILAEDRGYFPNFPDSIYANERPLRNSTLTTVAPTGTISIIAGCSSGIEPLFALVFDRKGSLDGTLDLEVNQAFVNIAKQQGFWTEDLAERLYAQGTAQGLDGVPDYWQKVFATAHEISPDWHIRMQAAWQKHIDNGISKTINLNEDATVEDIDEAYRLAYALGCKGITVYRDGCKEGVMHVGTKETKVAEASTEVAGLAGSGLDGADDVWSHPLLVGPVHDIAPSIPQRPSVLKGETHRIETPLGTAYITINEDGKGDPTEVFVTQGKAGSDIAPLSEAIGKLTSMLLRVPSTMAPRARLQEVVNRLRGIGGSATVGFGNGRTRSLPDALAKVLEGYLAGEVDDVPPGFEWVESDACGPMLEPIAPHRITQEICPDCGVLLSLEEGCAKCPSCGYARC